MLTRSRKTIETESGKLEIYGNNHCRDLLYWYDLTEKEQQDFDFTDREDSSYFRYKGNVYTLGDIMRLSAGHPFGDGFDGYHSEGFFSGILVKLSDCGDALKVFTYIS